MHFLGTFEHSFKVGGQVVCNKRHGNSTRLRALQTNPCETVWWDNARTAHIQHFYRRNVAHSVRDAEVGAGVLVLLKQQQTRPLSVTSWQHEEVFLCDNHEGDVRLYTLQHSDSFQHPQSQNRTT